MGMKLAASTAVDLAALFFKILPLSFWETIVTLSNKFCYTDWVVEKFGKDRDGNCKKVRYFEDVRPDLVTGCKINPNKSKLKSLRLGAVWSFINDGETLAGAHDSLLTPGHRLTS